MRSNPNQDAVLSIKDLTRYIKLKLEGDAKLQDVWIRGEISNFTHHSRGHMYFTIKDADSRIKCIMFASYNQKLGFLPREGTGVLARGSISVYDRDGQYQFYVTQMQPDGVGSLHQAYEKLKRKLEEEGLFAQDLKKPLPKFPRAVGVITSPTGAAVRDIITTLQRRYPAVPIVLYPVLVQGAKAAESVARAIDEMNRLGEADVLIVGRGGGSLEELWAFNEEVVARSIFRSALPVISAVGHETDFTIADFAADVRAATPTAAAELAVPHHLDIKQQLQHLTRRMQQGMAVNVQGKKEALARLRKSPYLLYPKRHLLERSERLDRLSDKLGHRMQALLAKARERGVRLEKALAAYNPKQQVRFESGRLAGLKRQLLQSMQAGSRDQRTRLQGHIRQLDALSPLKVMQRGYSLLYNDKETELIRSIRQVQPGDPVKVRLADGRLECQVWGMEVESDG